jgi:hypothetical protein
MKKLFEKIDSKDVLLFGGLSMTGVGVGAIYPAAALIVVGAVLFGLGIFSYIRRGA